MLISKIPARLKEWAYAGFAYDFIFAAISHGAVDGLNFQSFFPLAFLAILMLSYVNYHKLQAAQQAA